MGVPTIKRRPAFTEVSLSLSLSLSKVEFGIVESGRRGDGSDRTYGILDPEAQGSVGSRSDATTAPAERGPTE